MGIWVKRSAGDDQPFNEHVDDEGNARRYIDENGKVKIVSNVVDLAEYQIYMDNLEHELIKKYGYVAGTYKYYREAATALKPKLENCE